MINIIQKQHKKTKKKKKPARGYTTWPVMTNDPHNIFHNRIHNQQKVRLPNIPRTDTTKREREWRLRGI